PFAGMIGAIAQRTQAGGEQLRPGRSHASGAATQTGQRVAPNFLRVITSEQGGAGRPAARGIVKLRKTKSARCQAIKIWSLDLAAVTAGVGKTHVVREDDEKVGFVGS